MVGTKILGGRPSLTFDEKVIYLDLLQQEGSLGAARVSSCSC